MYGADSFFTLSTSGQIGLLVLSLGLALGCLVLTYRLARGRHWAVRLGIAVLCYALFVWLSPQVYYGYYLMIFEGLPVQWVIGAPPVLDMVTQAVFAGRQTLSAHGQGALFWALILTAARARGRTR